MYNVCKSLWNARLNPMLFYDVLMHWCRAVFISAAFICTCPPRLSLILSSSRRGGEVRTSWCFSFTVIGWFKAASTNCGPPWAPIALHLCIYAPYFCLLYVSPACLLRSHFFFLLLQSDLCGRVLDRCFIDSKRGGNVTVSHLRACNRRLYGFAKKKNA